MYSKITLLPDEFKKRNQLRKKMYYIVTISASITIILALFFTFVFIYRIKLNSDLREIIKQKEGIPFQISSMKEFEDMDKDIKTLESLLKNTKTNFIDWEAFLLKISNLTPSGLSLIEIKTLPFKEASKAVAKTTTKPDSKDTTKKDAPPKEKINIKFKGNASDSYKSAMFLQNLRNISELSNIKCTYSEKKQLGLTLYYEFEITSVFTNQK